MTVRAEGAALVAFAEEGGAWNVLSTDANGEASFEPSSPFVLVRACEPAHVAIVLAAPGDARRWDLGCPEGTVEITVDDGGAGGTVFIGSSALTVFGPTTMRVAPGVRDVVYENGEITVIRDVLIEAGAEIVIDPSTSAPYDAREVTLTGERNAEVLTLSGRLVTSNGTVFSWHAGGEAGIDTVSSRAFPSSLLRSGDRVRVTAWTHSPAYPEHAFHALEVDPDGSALAFDLGDRDGTAEIDGPSPVEVSWGPSALERNRITAVSVVRIDESWRMDAYPGWVDAGDTPLAIRLPTIDPPGWRAEWAVDVTSTEWWLAIGVADRDEARGFLRARFPPYEIASGPGDAP